MTEIVMSAVDVNVRFGGLRALVDLNLEVRSGEVLGIVGPNGAGKSTLFNVLAGAIRPSSGQVFLEGRDITRSRDSERAQMGISRTFQTVRPFLDETLTRNVAVAALAAGKGRTHALDIAAELLEQVGLSDRSGLLASELGHGERKRLELARAFAVQPKVLMLDEVMAGLNPSEVRGIVELIRGLCRTRQCELVLIEHLLSAVRSLADRVIVLDAGRVLADGTADDVFADPKDIEAYLGTKYANS